MQRQAALSVLAGNTDSIGCKSDWPNFFLICLVPKETDKTDDLQSCISTWALCPKPQVCGRAVYLESLLLGLTGVSNPNVSKTRFLFFFAHWLPAHTFPPHWAQSHSLICSTLDLENPDDFPLSVTSVSASVAILLGSVSTRDP